MSLFSSWAQETRRHTVDNTNANGAITPPLSRPSSVASNRSEPSWFSAYEGVDTSKTRSESIASNRTKLVQKAGTTSTSGWKALFSQDDRKERKKQKQKDTEKIVLGSRHAAAVRTKLATDPKYAERRKSADDMHIMNGTQNSAHITAGQQEMRFPHSGAPALHGGSKGNLQRKGRSGENVPLDMPSLTRIISGDERDDEEDRARQERELWVLKRENAEMRRFTVAEGEGDSEEEEETEEVKIGGTVIEVKGTKMIGMELTDTSMPTRQKPKSGMGAGWRRDDTGKWTR
jgi:hypothetical protein